jgi:hypothetical protein
VFHLNGTELTRFNFAAATVVTPTSLAETGVGDAVVTGPLTLPASLLRQGTNVLAVQVHQNNTASSDIVFGAQLDIVGGTVASLSPGAPNNVAGSLPSFPAVFINELSPVAGTLRDSAGDAEPWIELLNAGATDEPLTGWTLAASGAPTPWTFPTGSILRAGERRLLFLDGETSEGTPTEWHAALRPAAAGGWISLARPAANGSGIVDFVTYGAPVAGRALTSFPEGQPFQRDWLTPTPGTRNPAPVVEAPVLTATLAPEGLLLRWQGISGNRYRLEAAASLGTAWINLQNFDGNGAPIEVSLPSTPTDLQFYRLIAE